MKNMEINKKLGFKVVAVLTSASMVLGGLAGCGKNTTQDTTAIEQTSEAEESDDLLTNVMNQVVHHSSTAGTELQKDEVVYVMADAQGNTQKIIVSDCLKNANGDSTIKDASSLSDIVNVKGDESYTVDADGNLVWNADGSDIYYQGTTDKELPVDVSISYELEGEEISPEDLVGKTGNVTIRFTYTNNEKTTVEVNGKEKEVYVPFAMISGALLPAEHFSDIEVTNGRVISEGDNNVVVGIAFPGLKDSINIDSLKDKAVDEEAKEKLDEVEIPETVEIHAYATDFEMNQTMTMAMSDLLSDLNLDDTLDIDTSKITDSMNELKDATQQLKDGSTELNDGMATLQEGAQTLADKSRDLDSGAGELKDGAQALNAGAESLNSGAGDLKAGIDQVDSGVSSLKNGTASLLSGANQLNSGAGQLRDGINQAAAGVDQLKSGLEADNGIIKGYAAAKAGVQELVGKISGISGMAGTVTQAVTNLGAYIANQAAEAGKAAAAGEPAAPQFEGSTPNFTGTAPEAPTVNEDGSYDGEAVAAYVQAVEEYQAAVASYQESVNNYTGAVDSYQKKVASYSADVANYYTNSGKLAAYQDAGVQVQNMAGALQQAIGGATGSEEDAAKIQQLLAGMEAISNGLNQLDAGVNQLRSGDDGKGGLVALQAGASQLADGTASAVDGAKQLDAGASQLKDGTSQLSSGAQILKDGTQTLTEGTISLLNGTVTLKDGTSQFVDGTFELNDGALQLLDGTGELMDGLFKFDEEGISKLTDLFGDNVQDVIDDLQAVFDAGRSYKIYSDSASDMDSSVKFIYKTEAVK